MEFLDWRVFDYFLICKRNVPCIYVGITRTKVLTMNAVVMAVTNVTLDYVLIFSNLRGFPAIGIKRGGYSFVVAEGGSILFFVMYTRLTVKQE